MASILHATFFSQPRSPRAACLSGVDLADAADVLAIEGNNALWLAISAAEADIRSNPESTSC
jgi:hypothetical protein